ncbi:hypothetical protein DRO21_05600 [archaeon]|nr:MAG: hypothetical protein DRO21_05600 [archaeon]
MRRFKEMRGQKPEEYRVEVSSVFTDFIREELEKKLGFALPPREDYMEGLVFRHKADIIYKPVLYIEAKVIFRPERVGPDHDKRMYQVALAAFDLKLRNKPDMKWSERKLITPHVSFALAIPVETPEEVRKHVEEDMTSLLAHYLDSCNLYIFDLNNMKRRDDLLSNRNLRLDEYLEDIAKQIKFPSRQMRF